MELKRRDFIKGIAAASATVATTGAFALGNLASGDTQRVQISYFTKLLDGYETSFMAETLAMAGIDSLDVTVRPKGKIEPERVKDDFPKYVETARKAGLRTDMMVTAIESPDEPYTRQVLETAAKLGVKHYRMNWLKYDFNKGIEQSLAGIKSKLSALAQLNQSIGIQAGYQNHSGNSFGAPLWDVYQVIRDLPLQWIGSQYDIRHAVVEGAASWVIAIDLLKKNIASLAIKDFTWEVSGNKAKILNVPLGEGVVDFDKYFSILKELQIKAPVTLHVEYPVVNADEEKLPLLQQQKIMVPKIKHDVDFIRNNFQKYQLG